MSSPPSPPPDPGRDGRPGGDRVVVSRALLLLAAALVLGIVLIGVAGRPPVLVGTSTVAASVTTTTGTGTTTTGVGSTGSVASSTTTAPATTTTARRSTTTTHRSGSKPAATTTTIARSSVKVLVANGTTTSGAAGRYTQVLQSQGWATQAPVNASQTASTSTVFYAAGQQAAASAIASSLGLSSSSVQPLTGSVPVAGTGGMDVVLVVGPDLAAQSSVPTTASQSG